MTGEERAGVSRAGRYLILAAAFLGWAGAGLQMALMNLASRSATEEFLLAGVLAPAGAAGHAAGPEGASVATGTARAKPGWLAAALKQQAPLWFSWYNSAFLFGAALGGAVFGWFGDYAGRVRAMALSIAWYSGFAALGYLVNSPQQLLVLRFVSAMGVGGMWPAGVSLASEAWSNVSRPALSGLIGTAANVGIVLMGILGYMIDITAESWRWIMLVAASPFVLGIVAWIAVPESPGWLAARRRQRAAGQSVSMVELFRPRMLRLTILGILLGAIPLLGGWGVTGWLILWADSVHGAADPRAKALTSIMRAGGGALGSLIGGWLANLLGRRTTYFLISITTLFGCEWIYFFLNPRHAWFSEMVFLVGFVSTIFFGWLPLYLPELFPTATRALGTGVSFNMGRVLTAAGVLGTGALVNAFQGDYAAAGRINSLIYAAGMIVILFAPDTTLRRLDDERH